MEDRYLMGRIITFAQQKGGSGKTTMAAHVAVALQRSGLTVALLDVDPQGSLGEWFERREAAAGDVGPGLSFGTASGWGARREARSLARDHDVVVVDTPPKSDSESRPAVEAADLVCVPVQPTPVDLWATAPTLEMVQKQGTRSLIIVNRAVGRATLTGEMLKVIHELGHPAAAAVIGSRVAFAASMGAGLTVMETAPGGKAAAEIEALAQEVMRHATS
jgi:chromosome partitioning protein